MKAHPQGTTAFQVFQARFFWSAIWLINSFCVHGSTSQAQEIQHSYLVMGARTAIIAEDGSIAWEYTGGSRDGFVLPTGNILLAFADRVEEVTPERKILFSYRLSPENQEIGTTQRLYNGNTLITELGKKPRLLEVSQDGKIVHDILARS